MTTNYPHGASYDPGESLIYQLLDATDVPGLTRVYLAVLDVNTKQERYRVPLEGSAGYANPPGGAQISFPIVMPGSGHLLVHLRHPSVANTTAIYDALTGLLVASHVDTFATEWREVMKLGTRWVFFGLSGGGGVAGIVDLAAGTLGVSTIGSGINVSLVTRGRTTPGSVSFFVVEAVGGGWRIREAVYGGGWAFNIVITPASTGSPVTSAVPVIWYDSLTGYFVFLDRIGAINRFKYVNPSTGAIADTFDAAAGKTYISSHNLVAPLRFTSSPGFLLMQEISAGNNVDVLDIQQKTISPFVHGVIAANYTCFSRVIFDQSRGIYITAEENVPASPAANNWTVWRIANNAMIGLLDLDDIVTDAMYLAGFGPPDLTFEGFSGLTSYGFTISADTTIQAVVRAISDIYGFAWCDTGSGFVFKKPGTGALLSIDAAFETADIVERDQPVMSQDEANIRTPSAIEMQYMSKEGPYKTRPTSFNMTTGVLNSITTPKFSTPMLMSDNEAQRIVQEKFFEFQEKRRSHTLAVAPENITLLPGDIVTFPSGSVTYITRVEEIGIDLRNMGIEISARDFQTEVETVVTSVSNNGPVWQVVTFASQYFHLDMPLLYYADDTGGTSLVQYGTLVPRGQTLWSGGSLYRSPVTTGFVQIFSQLPHAGVMGVCTTVLNPPVDPFALTDASTVTIQRVTANTPLANATEAEVLAGANNALIGIDGRWEWVGYKTVVDNLNGTFTLSGFVRRGYRGSEVFCGLHELGDVFIALDGWTRKMAHPVTDLGATKYYKAIGIGQNPSVVPITQHVITGAAETPYACVNLDAEVGSPNGLDISWDYRSRIATGLNPAAFGEDTLAFEVDIYDGATYKRTLTTTTNSVHYATADVAADLGSDPPDELTFRVFMMSALPILVPGQERPVAGRGYEARGFVSIDGATNSVTGQGIAVSVGTVTVTAIGGTVVPVTGQNIGVSVGIIVGSSVGTTASVTGQAASVSVGTVTVSTPVGVTANVTGQAVTASVGTASAQGDAYISSVKLLLGFENASVITDESPAAHGNATIIGGATMSTSSPIVGTRSLLLDGNGDGCSFPDHADWTLSTANSDQFTIEARIRPGTIGWWQTIVAHLGPSIGDIGWVFWIAKVGSAFELEFLSSVNGFSNWDAIPTSSGLTWTSGTTYHVAVDKDATGKVRIYRDGVMVGSATPSSSVTCNVAFPLYVGYEPNNRAWATHIDELRITKGVARYASDSGYTPIAGAFPRT